MLKETTAHHYEPLLHGNTFRYLSLDPGTGDEPLVCSLRVASLLDDDAALFEAISYVWGSEVRDHEIICDGAMLNITTNLFEALEKSRLPHQS